MKRLLVFPLLVVASLILSACIGTAQATVNPGPTSGVPNTGGETAVPNVSTMSSTSAAMNMNGTLGTPSVPNTGGAVVPALPTSGVSGDILSTYSPDMYGATTGGTVIPNTGGVWTMDGTIIPPAAGSAATQIPPESFNQYSFATSEAYNATTAPGSTGQIGIATSVPATGATQQATGMYSQNYVGTSQAYSVTSVPGGVGVPATGATAVPGGTQGQAGQSVRLSSLINYTLNDNSGAVLGQITDFVINPVTTHVDYVVLSANNRQVLVPWTMIGAVNSAARSLPFNGSTAGINGAPAFDRNTVDFTQQNWNQSVQNYWQSAGTGTSSNTGVGTSTAGLTGTGAPTTTGQSGSTGSGNNAINANATAYLYSQLINVQVWAMGINGSLFGQPNAGGNNTNIVLGAVQDAIVDTSTGNVPYLLISSNFNIQGLQNRFIPVPFKALTRANNGGNLVLGIDVNTLRNAPNFDATGLPNSFNFGWDTSILNYWSGLFGGQSTATP